MLLRPPAGSLSHRQPRPTAQRGKLRLKRKPHPMRHGQSWHSPTNHTPQNGRPWLQVRSLRRLPGPVLAGLSMDSGVEVLGTPSAPPITGEADAGATLGEARPREGAFLAFSCSQTQLGPSR